MIKPFVETLNTSGDGLWSNTSTPVAITAFEVAYVNNEGDFGELRVYFDKTTWDINERGLIYTDGLFIEELKSALEQQGFDPSGISYSEQGMQGTDYVSLDVDSNFLDTFLPVQALLS